MAVPFCRWWRVMVAHRVALLYLYQYCVPMRVTLCRACFSAVDGVFSASCTDRWQTDMLRVAFNSPHSIWSESSIIFHTYGILLFLHTCQLLLSGAKSNHTRPISKLVVTSCSHALKWKHKCAILELELLLLLLAAVELGCISLVGINVEIVMCNACHEVEPTDLRCLFQSLQVRDL